MYLERMDGTQKSIVRRRCGKGKTALLFKRPAKSLD